MLMEIQGSNKQARGRVHRRRADRESHREAVTTFMNTPMHSWCGPAEYARQPTP